VNNKPAFIAFVLLLIFISGSIWLVFEYLSAEKQRDINAWQARLSIMAESQQQSVESWFAKQLENISMLAKNPLMQLYVSQSASGKKVSDETSRGQLNHLKNLLNATANRASVFTPVDNIKSNTDNKANDGIAVFNESDMVLATRYFPTNALAVNEAYKRALKNQAIFISNIVNIGNDASGKKQPRLLIVVPVNSVQSLSPKDFRGVVIAVLNPENNLFQLLSRPWLTTASEETLLVSLDKESVNYLSPLKQGFELFHKQTKATSASANAANNISGFVVHLDYRQIQVLATARNLRHSLMVLVQKIDVDEALLESTAHQNFILTVFLLVIFIIAISFIAIWRHATSLRLQKAMSRLKARAELLNAIGDSVNDHTFLLDHNSRLVFINRIMAKSFSVDNAGVRGKALNHIFDNEITSQLLAMKPGSNEDDTRNKVMRLAFEDKRYDYHVSVITLKHIDYKQSHLYVMHDITKIKDAQGRHNRMLQGIISTLVQLIDKHDPHCVHHSRRTREVAVAIARVIELPQERVDNLAMAALLANIGKLYVPAGILTSIEPLTEEDELILKESVNYSVEILRDIEFEGPIITFILQKNEYLDGSGYPEGVAGDDIAQESRILAVANVFVAMTSSRAYRAGMPVKEVLDVLISQVDSRYDRHVIDALIDVVENHSDWLSWQQVS
jgi:HD-GYP domain-containing protein (c-di-GMP phosphodiesterase class II)